MYKWNKKWLKRIIALAILGIMVFAFAGCGSDVGNDTENAQLTEQEENNTTSDEDGEMDNNSQEEQESDENVTDSGIQMSDDLADFTFSINGTVYQLPCSMQVFFDNGWIPRAALKDETAVGKMMEADTKFSTTMFISKENQDTFFQVMFLTPEASMKPMNECTVYGISASASNAEIVLPGGLKIEQDMTTGEEIDAVFGGEYVYGDVEYCFTKNDEGILTRWEFKIRNTWELQ